MLWCLIVATIISFQRINILASLLLYPYLAWSTFASALTFSVWRLNPGFYEKLGSVRACLLTPVRGGMRWLASWPCCHGSCKGSSTSERKDMSTRHRLAE